MKRITAMMMVLAMAVSLGCVTPATTVIPPECKDSLIYQNKAVIDIVLSVAISAAHVAAAEKPAWYNLAHIAAQQAAALLLEKPVTLAEITSNPYLNVLGPLAGLIPIDKVLGQCDREYIANFLLQV